MGSTREQAQKGAAKTNEQRRAEVARRRAQVEILRLAFPSRSAEDVARDLKCSPSTVRGDWRALRKSSERDNPDESG